MKQDYLNEDPPVSGQKFVCISFLMPSDKNDTNVRGIKVRGSFSTHEDASKHAERLRKIDPCHNIYVGEVGKWLPFNPSTDEVKEHDYAEKELNNIMKNYQENMEKAKELHAERKNEMMDNIKKENKEKKKKNKKKKKKKSKLKKQIEVDEDVEQNFEDNMKKLKEEEDGLLEEKNKLKKEKSEINQFKNNIDTIDSELNELKKKSNVTV